MIYDMLFRKRTTSRDSINDECFKENDMHILLGYYEAIWNLHYKKKLIGGKLQRLMMLLRLPNSLLF